MAKNGVKKPNWVKIRKEYETIGTPYRKLAVKYSVSVSTLSKRALREKWVENKQVFDGVVESKVDTKLRQKYASRKADKIVADIEAEEEAVSLIHSLILEALRDNRQFYKHAVEQTFQTIEKVDVELASGKISGKVFKLDNSTVVAKDLGIMDTRRLKDAMSTMAAATSLKRLIKGILTVTEEETLALNRERLDLDKKKSNLFNEDEEDNTGVLILPETDVTLLDNAIVEEEKIIDTGHKAAAEEEDKK